MDHMGAFPVCFSLAACVTKSGVTGRWGVLAEAHGAAIASAAGAGCVREASCWARVERCCGSLGFCAAAVTEEGGAGSADRLTANRWLSGSAFWLFGFPSSAFSIDINYKCY